jgi:hypothetical protein
MKVQKIENIQKALTAIKDAGITLDNIGSLLLCFFQTLSRMATIFSLRDVLPTIF